MAGEEEEARGGARGVRAHRSTTEQIFILKETVLGQRARILFFRY